VKAALTLLVCLSSLSAFGSDPLLKEVVFGSRKFCIYTVETPERLKSVACSVNKDEECVDLADCKKDPDVVPRAAKSEDDKDTLGKKEDGTYCTSSSQLQSIHHTNGIFFCSTMTKCGTKEENYLDRASCLGTPDPDKEGYAICPGLSVCMSPKKVLPRPPVSQVVTSNPTSTTSAVAGTPKATTKKSPSRGVHK